MSISTDYLLSDGSPRYGIRTETALPSSAPAWPDDARLVPREASRLGLQHLAAAIDSRLTRAWADKEDPLLAALRAGHPAELAAAEDLVNAELGGRTAWLRKAQANRAAFLAPVAGRRQADGRYGTAVLQRAVLVLVLTGVAGAVAAATQGNLLPLLAAGLAVCGLAYVLGNLVTARLRLPVPARLQSAWLEEIRRDITDATLLSILRSKGVDVDERTARAAVRGWEHLRFVAAKVDEIHAGS
ncbi:hypothetical protein [Arthrobacter mobilis]|uniref:Uncharacterized protein n=1 Tax=Arthrobacter mobilis TaxID=2724944 RepID=A0A7X6HI03_9MICC|nr:hypothetical protein [Arthrobacter mobilis]NKX56252.1 hypothetical protein [Arthrobacter mobilis]